MFKSDFIKNHLLKTENWNPAKEIPNDYISYIDLSSIDKERKMLVKDLVQIIPSNEAPSRARQKTKKGDILVATVRPNLNSVAMIESDLKNLTSSTGYCVLRTKETLDSKYLFYCLQTKSFVNDMVMQATGANYPAVSDKIIKQFKIPLPPLATQKKIAAILDAADAHRQKTKELLSKYDELAQSVFLEMFGDPVTNPKGWEIKKMKEITSKIMSGNTPKGGKEVYVENGILFLRSQNVWRNKLDLEDVAFIDEETHQKMKRSTLKDGDILMTKTGRFNTENSSLGRAAMFRGIDGSANVNGHVYFMRPKTEVNRDFVLYILTTNQYRDYIRRICVGGIDKRQLNKDHLEDFPIIYPKRELQDSFTEKLKLINQQKELLEKEDLLSNDLFNGLLQKAFKGDLVK